MCVLIVSKVKTHAKCPPISEDRAAAARGLLGSRDLVVNITDFTDYHTILRGFQRCLRKLGRYFTPKHPQEPPLGQSDTKYFNVTLSSRVFMYTFKMYLYYVLSTHAS